MKKVSFVTAFKIWWSFTWRSYLIMTPLAVALGFIMSLLEPAHSDRSPISLLPGLIFFLFIMTGSQTWAIIWMLKTRWSTFRLEVIQEQEPTN